MLCRLSPHVLFSSEGSTLTADTNLSEHLTVVGWIVGTLNASIHDATRPRPGKSTIWRSWCQMTSYNIYPSMSISIWLTYIYIYHITWVHRNLNLSCAQDHPQVRNLLDLSTTTGLRFSQSSVQNLSIIPLNPGWFIGIPRSILDYYNP